VGAVPYLSSGVRCSKGFRFTPEIIVLAVRLYLRYGLSYRDVEELLVDRGIDLRESRSPVAARVPRGRSERVAADDHRSI
jgi:transposase-like protein